MGIRMLPNRESPFGFSRLPGPQMAGWMLRFASAANKRRADRAAPYLRDLHLASRNLFEERFDPAVIGYERSGSIMLCKTDARFLAEREFAKEAEHLGLRTQVLGPADLREIEPGITLDVAGGVLFEDDAFMTPRALMDSLRADLIRRGCEIRQSESVIDVTRKGNAVAEITTSKERLPVEELVIAAGAWTGSIGEKLQMNLPMAAGKGYGFTVPAPPERPTKSAILVDGRVAVTPMQDGLRFVGTMELGPAGAPTVNQSRLTGMRKSIESAYPAFRGFDWNPIPVWAGLRPCTPDGLPYVGRPGSLANVTIAAGHAMIGLSLGPITGELVAQIIAGEEPSHPLDLLSPNRYA
jgi:D-amino-acid dehydrogenase